jgi:hypothetical protein
MGSWQGLWAMESRLNGEPRSTAGKNKKNDPRIAKAMGPGMPHFNPIVTIHQEIPGTKQCSSFVGNWYSNVGKIVHFKTNAWIIS